MSIFASKTAFDALDVDFGEESEEETVPEVPEVTANQRCAFQLSYMDPVFTIHILQYF